MIIAISSDGKTLENAVSQQFELCRYLLIVDTSDLSVQAIENKEDLSSEMLAKKIVDCDCEGTITGELKVAEFNVLADAYITRYSGLGYSGVKALDLMKKRELTLIKTHDGAVQCEGTHQH